MSLIIIFSSNSFFHISRAWESFFDLKILSISSLCSFILAYEKYLCKPKMPNITNTKIQNSAELQVNIPFLDPKALNINVITMAKITMVAHPRPTFLRLLVMSSK